MLQASITQRTPERTLVSRVCDELTALHCVRVWARGDGRHVLLGLNGGVPFARLTSLGGDSFGLAFLPTSDADVARTPDGARRPGAGPGQRASKLSAGHTWELLLIDDLPAVVEHALIGADALPRD
jgi:hypothetical protein